MPIINSMLDTDLYKLTMGQAVLRHYEGWNVTYEFINRGNRPFPPGFHKLVQQEVEHLANLSLQPSEHEFLRNRCRFLKRSYLDFLMGFRFNPDEVAVSQIGDKLIVTISGPWYRTVYYEVPLMAIISELFFQTPTMRQPKPHFVREAEEKGLRLANAGCRFSEFGTRRRFSYHVQDQVVKALHVSAGSNLVGTSNVHLAMKHNLTPIGTQAHEFFMAIASQFGYVKANANALKAWQKEFDGDLGIALTDTFTSDEFFKQFTMDFAKLFDGVRQDSGDPFGFGEKTINHYLSLKIPPIHKTIIFSDGLDVDNVINLQTHFATRIGCGFGIGTHFTNDVGYIPLNIVIKMISCNGLPTIKLSDAPGKNTGDPDTIRAVKHLLKIA